jgi:twitching motility protein PilT
VSQREVGIDVPSFADALRASLRETPDVILVGEMRDLDSTRLAIAAAETGHLVLSSVHTQSAQNTVERIIDEFPPNQQEQIRIQLANSLLAVLAQSLVPRLSGGLVAAFEILLVTPAVRHLIRDNKTFRIDSAIQTSRDKGMQLLDDHLLQLYEKGLIERTEVLTRCRYPEEVAKALMAMGV